MKRLMVIAAVLALSGAMAFAADAPAADAAAKSKKYQVTGPVLEVTDARIVVQKGAEKWEIARDAATTVKGDLKVGEKVTIEYKMIAASIEVKTEAPKKADAAKKPAAK